MRRKGWIALAAGCACLALCFPAAGEVSVALSAEEAAAGSVVDVRVDAGEGAETVTYVLTRDGQTVFEGKEDDHFEASFRPRQEGNYEVEARVRYGDGSEDGAAASVRVSGWEEETQGPDRIYSQKDGWWKDKPYGKSDLDNAGCAIFSLSHALQRMGWTGEDIAPENLAVTHKNCYTKNGTAVARLVYNAGQIYGYTTKSALLKDQTGLREGLRNGDYYSFSIVIGHIALMTGVDEKAGKVRVVDSAPSATFERIKKGAVYYLRDGEYVKAETPGEIPGARYYFETRYYGGLEYYMDLEYCARRGGRLIRPAWVYYLGPEGKIGATLEQLGSGESEISVNGTQMTVPTRDLSWGEDGKPRLAVVTSKKAVRLLNEAGKRIATVGGRTVIPVLREEEDRILVMDGDQRGYLKKSETEVLEPIQGEIAHGLISVNGSTSGRATVKMRYGPSEKERVMASWKTGTRVTLIRQEKEFWQVEAEGLRVWVHQDYLTREDEDGQEVNQGE